MSINSHPKKLWCFLQNNSDIHIFILITFCLEVLFMQSIKQITDLEYICHLAYSMFKIPTYFFSSEGELIYKAADSNFHHNPIYQSNMDVIIELFSKTEKQKVIPILKETAFLEKYVSLSIYSNNHYKGNIIVGPVINFRMTDETITSSLKDMDIRVAKEVMFHYYSNLPVLSNLKFIKFIMMIYYMIYQKQLNILDIIKNNKEIEEENLDIDPIDNQIIESRQNKNVHTDISLEKKFLNYIKIGKKTGLLESFHAINKQGKKGILSKTSYLRSQKNIAISLITLATRAAVEGGLYQEIAYSLSDSYIIKLEELSNSRAVDQLIENALIDFAERVENSKKYKYSKPINVCQTYIFNHLYENITLSELANLTGLNPNYLSNLFKKEVGISIKAFIQKTKIDEAKNLLSYSNYSLTEISTLLNFHDQSYFTRIFKQVTGITPKQYINKNC